MLCWSRECFFLKELKDIWTKHKTETLSKAVSAEHTVMKLILHTTDLAMQMQMPNTPSLGELVRGGAWQTEQIQRRRIRSVPSDAQGFMGLVQIVFPSVQIKQSERAEQKPWGPAAEWGLVRVPERCEDLCECVHHADGDGARFLLCGSAGRLGEIGTKTRTETGDLQAEQVAERNHTCGWRKPQVWQPDLQKKSRHDEVSHDQIRAAAED